MKLPTYEEDHYTLGNGEELNREFPDTFHIPDQSTRNSLKIGDIVKLIFRMEETPGSDELSVERMWVEITEVHSGYYVGRLDNDPYGSECLQSGLKVVFEPCHVIGVYG